MLGKCYFLPHLRLYSSRSALTVGSTFIPIADNSMVQRRNVRLPSPRLWENSVSERFGSLLSHTVSRCRTRSLAPSPMTSSPVIFPETSVYCRHRLHLHGSCWFAVHSEPIPAPGRLSLYCVPSFDPSRSSGTFLYLPTELDVQGPINMAYKSKWIGEWGGNVLLNERGWIRHHTHITLLNIYSVIKSSQMSPVSGGLINN